MRLIGTLDDEKKGLAFSLFLNRKGIAHQMEVIPNRDWGSTDYGTSQCRIWISEEDQFEEAIVWYQHFLDFPNDPLFQVVAPTFQAQKPLHADSFPSSPQLESKDKVTRLNPKALGKLAMGPLTRILLIGCCLLFFLAQFLAPHLNLPTNIPATPLFSSPVEKVILYDYPHTYEMVDRLIKLYGYEALQDTAEIPADGQLLIKKINDTPYWQGIYNVIQKNGFRAIPEKIKTTPMFEKINQGQLWRLITPAFFHADLFHLFFNMLWLMVLGKEIEQRLGGWRYIFFILIVGIISNTGQYLMGGPNFIGFSGILCGMLTFIWARQRYAPWEGYQLDKATIVFMLLFIAVMALIQFFSFFLEKTSDISISPGIANVAHLSGAVLGFILGRFNFFSWRTT